MPSEQETSELDLMRMYRRKSATHLEFSCALRRHLEHFGGSRQGLARRIGVHPSTIHGHISILDLPLVLLDRVAKGQLRHKVARALADLPDPKRQIEIADLFPSNAGTSHIEQLVVEAKRQPMRPAAGILRQIVLERAIRPYKPDRSREQASITSQKLETYILRLAEMVSAARGKNLSLLKRIRIREAAKVLNANAEALLEENSSHNAKVA